MEEAGEFRQPGKRAEVYPNPDMNIELGSLSKTTAEFVRTSGSAGREGFLRETPLFERRRHSNSEGQFRRRYWFDFTLNLSSQTVGEFFEMIRAIVAIPELSRSGSR